MKISAIVKTNSKESKIFIKDDIYYIYTKSPAKENKANIEVVRLLSEYFDIPKSNIDIKKGLKSKSKIVEICD